MKFILVGIVFLIIYLICLYYPIYRASQIAEKTIAHNIPYEQHPHNPSMYILVAGDSSAAGVGAITPKESIAGRLGQKYPDADLLNIGVSGAQIEDLLNVLKTQKKHYDLILLQIGANDVTHFSSYQTIRKGITEVLAISDQLGTKTVLLTSGDLGVIPIFHWPLSWIMTDRTRKVRDIFVEESSKYNSVSYIDLFYELKRNRVNLTNSYAPDSFHLNEKGYEVYYHFVEEKLK